MNMILHITRKDLRRHWPEITGFIVVIAGWAWQRAHPQPWRLALHASEALPVVIFVLWFLLVIRVVQGEALVGDREFWQTRPYCWWQLALAKALVLGICINLPLLVAQIYLLASQHIPFTRAWIPGVLWLQLLYFTYFILPAAAFAAITPSIVQWVLTLIGIGVTYLLISWFPWSNLPMTLVATENLATLLGVITIASVFLVLAIWQYARPNLVRSRILAASAALIGPFFILFASTTMARNLAYPMTTDAPVRFEIATDGGPHYSRAKAIASSTIFLPVNAAGLSNDTIVSLEGVRVHFMGDGGWQWDSDWMNVNFTFSYFAKQHEVSTSVTDDVADALQSRHAKAVLEMALAIYHLAPPHVLQTGDERFTLPSGATCRWETESSLDCAAAFRKPDVTVFEVHSDTSTCGQGLPSGHVASNVDFDQSPFPADFDIYPVQRYFFYTSPVWDPPIPDPHNPRQNLSAGWCRGTPFTVRDGSFVKRMQITFDLGHLGREITPVDSGESLTFPFRPGYR